MHSRPSPSLQELALANGGLLLMIFSWGAFFPVLEHLLKSWDLYSATLGRQVFGILILGACVYALRHREPIPKSIPWKRVFMLGGVGVSIGSLLTTFGVMFSDGLSSAIISTTNPVTSALTAALLYREPLGRGLIFATVLSVAGGLVSVAGGESLSTAHFRGGEILIILANVLWTWMSMAAQRWLQGFTQLQITALTVGSGATWLAVMAPFVYLSGAVPLRIDLSLEALAMIIFAGAGPIAIGNFCWHYGVSRLGVVVASIYSNLLPAAALAMTVLLGGSFTWHQLVGSAIILCGVLTAQLLALRKN